MLKKYIYGGVYRILFCFISFLLKNKFAEQDVFNLKSSNQGLKFVEYKSRFSSSNDIKKSIYWYKKAAKKGHNDAKYNLNVIESLSNI